MSSGLAACPHAKFQFPAGRPAIAGTQRAGKSTCAIVFISPTVVSRFREWDPSGHRLGSLLPSLPSFLPRFLSPSLVSGVGPGQPHPVMVVASRRTTLLIHEYEIIENQRCTGRAVGGTHDVRVNKRALDVRTSHQEGARPVRGWRWGRGGRDERRTRKWMGGKGERNPTGHEARVVSVSRLNPVSLLPG